MNPKQFITQELSDFIHKFQQTRVRYEFDMIAKTHFIEVVPNEVYHLDKNYIQWESIFFESFIRKYPDQNICFLSDDVKVGLEKIDFELIGTNFTSPLDIISF